MLGGADIRRSSRLSITNGDDSETSLDLVDSGKRPSLFAHSARRTVDRSFFGIVSGNIPIPKCKDTGVPADEVRKNSPSQLHGLTVALARDDDAFPRVQVQCSTYALTVSICKPPGR
jgi:hypothetical protein